MGGVGSGAKPREYPAEIVQLVRDLYEQGHSIKEIRELVPRGFKVQNIFARYAIPTRSTAKRNQTGPRNHMWRGDSAQYKALHLRVAAARGKPSLCEWCGVTEGRFEWANLTGAYEDISDYSRLCLSCHRTYDARRRRETGRSTMKGR